MAGNRCSAPFYSKVTVAIDCRWIDSSGIGVYLRECLPFFLDSAHSFVLLGNSEKLSCIVSGKDNAEILDCNVKPFSAAELFFFPRTLLKKINSADLYYSPYFNIPGFLRIPVFTTIHDIIFPDMPELVSRTGLALRMWFYRRAFRRSAKIFTVSEFSKSRIEHYSGNNVPVTITHSAIQGHLLKKNSLPEKNKTILFIGNIKKHKGLNVLLNAFFEARREGLEYRLVIVGSRKNFRSKETGVSPGEQDSVEFIGFLSGEKLTELLAASSLLVQPSLYEGFCLPPLEALVSGTPVLISDIPVLREIYSEYPQKTLGRKFPVNWFKAGDVKDLKEKLLLLLKNKAANSIDPIDLHPELEKLYTFEKTSRTILDSLEET